MRIFVTGGAGYVGSHTLLEVLNHEHEVCVFDNYSNSSPEALKRVAKLTNRQFQTVTGDVRDGDLLMETVLKFRPDVVIHFAGLKSVAESVEKPLSYFDVNVTGSMKLLEAMDASGCQHIVFSSSATVYGQPHYLPYDEAHPLAPESPYGQSKLMVEEILAAWVQATPNSSAALLRYFNPVGAHPSGEIGEDPDDIPNNLMPFIAQVAVGRRKQLNVFGDDYETPDGTGVRDYIHVMDLAEAHAKTIDYVVNSVGAEAINIGTGSGVSVLDMHAAFEAASGQKIPLEIVGRRQGDIAKFWANPALAKEKLEWSANRSVSNMCTDAWAWQTKNPRGYES